MSDRYLLHLAFKTLRGNALADLSTRAVARMPTLRIFLGARRVIAEVGTVLLTDLNEECLKSAKKELQDNAVALRNDAAAPDATALAETVASEFDRVMATNVRGPML